MKNDVAASEEVCPQEVVGLRTKELWKSKSTTFSTAPAHEMRAIRSAPQSKTTTQE
nr:hypothetical protein PHYPA_008708 [Physcomitrium patens]